jgi:hypothetical protein
MDFKAYTVKPLLRSTQHVQKLHERLKMIEENVSTDRRINLAKCLGLAPSALKVIVARKRKIGEQIVSCWESCEKRKVGRESPSHKLK